MVMVIILGRGHCHGKYAIDQARQKWPFFHTNWRKHKEGGTIKHVFRIQILTTGIVQNENIWGKYIPLDRTFSFFLLLKEYKRGLEDDQISQWRTQMSQPFLLKEPSIIVNCIKFPGLLFIDWGDQLTGSQVSQVTLRLTLDPVYHLIGTNWSGQAKS